MELVQLSEHGETRPRTKQEIAQEIYDGINSSLRHLMDIEGLDTEHSRVVELRKERKIARRVLQSFEEPQELIQAA